MGDNQSDLCIEQLYFFCVEKSVQLAHNTTRCIKRKRERNEKEKRDFVFIMGKSLSDTHRPDVTRIFLPFFSSGVLVLITMTGDSWWPLWTPSESWSPQAVVVVQMMYPCEASNLVPGVTCHQFNTGNSHELTHLL